MLARPEGDFGKAVAERMSESNSNMINWTIAALGLQNEDKVLEIGFGNGSHVKKILSKGKAITYDGVDISKTMVSAAGDFLKQEHQEGKVRLHLASAEDMPFPPNTFDKILSVNTLYFWKSPEAILKEIAKVLKPEGTFCLSIRSRSFMKALPFSQYGFTLYNQDEVEALMMASGYRILNVTCRKEEQQKYFGVDLVADAIIVAASKI